MTLRVPYSEDYEPPAPILPIRVDSPAGGGGLGLVAIVDTGADMTILPAAVVHSLSLPIVGKTRIAGVTGAVRNADVHAAEVDFGGTTRLAEIVALGEEAILGRDVLNGFVLTLDGPRLALEVRTKRR